MLMGGFALCSFVSAKRALLVGPFRARKTRVMSVSETSATVKGLNSRSWMEGREVPGGVLLGGIER